MCVTGEWSSITCSQALVAEHGANLAITLQPNMLLNYTMYRARTVSSIWFPACDRWAPMVGYARVCDMEAWIIWQKNRGL